MPHIFTNAEYADMMYVYGFCDGSATAAFEEYRRRFPMDRIPDRREFHKVFNIMRESSKLPSVHVLSERARNQNMQEQEIFLDMVALLLSREYIQHVSVFHEHMYCKHCMKMTCTNFTHSLCKIYTQRTEPCIYIFVIGYLLITKCFH